MTSPLVSVCIVTYNHSAYIQDCLLSVLTQVLPAELEIIVGDDKSTDDTAEKISEIVQRFPGRIRHIRRVNNLGSVENLRDLIGLANGKYIAHLDGDDLWLPGKLAAQVAWLESHPDSPACYTATVVVNDAQEMLGTFSSRIVQPIDLEFLLEKGNFLSHSSMMYRGVHKRDILALSAPFIDYQIHLGFTRHGTLGFLNAAYVVYRMGTPSSLMRNSLDMVRTLYFDAITATLAQRQSPRHLRQRALSHFWKMVATESIHKKRIKWGLEWSRKIKSQYPDLYWGVMLRGSLQTLATFTQLALRRLMIKLFDFSPLRRMYDR